MSKLLKIIFLVSVILLMFTVVYADDLWGPPDDPFDPSWLPPAGGDKGLRTTDTTLTISQLTHSEFPTITTYVDIVDENGDPIPGLTWEDFCVYQDGMPVGSFTVDSILGDSCHTSVCLVMDISSSMCFPTSASLNGAKAAAHQFVDNMDDFDRVAIVTFSTCVNTLINYTSNRDSLHAAINSLACGGFTAAFDGIWLGVDETSTELGSKAVIAFTDGMENRSQDCWPPPDGIFYDRQYSDDSIIICDKANASGVPIYTIGLGVAGEVAEPLMAFANGTGGFYTYAPTADDMEFVYTQIKERICKRYIITYTSPDIVQDGDIHEVVICLGGSGSCSFGAESFCDTAYYQETAPPEINQTPATLALLETCQPVGTAIQICADVTDLADPPIQLVQLFYRKAGTTSYTSVAMTGNPYCAEIPAAVVGAGPGVEYYIVASDGEQTVSDPPQSQNPQANPYYIEMCANGPPQCSVPNDTTIMQCTPAEVCLPVGCSDPDDNLTEGPTIVSGPGAIVGGNWCYTPAGDETVVVTIGCTDIVDEYCEAQFEVVFDINQPPVCSVPNDTAIFMCEPSEVCLPVSVTDPDGNLVGCEIISGPGALNGGNWCYTPAGDETVEVTVKCTDECDEYCQESFTVEFDINEAPVCSLPDDIEIFQCTPAQICLPISATDADGNLTGCEIIAGPGEINGGNWCYTPSGDESFAVTIKCTDECGAFCQGTFQLSVDINEAPVCTLPQNQSFFLCSDSSFSFPISAADGDGNLTGCTMTSGAGGFDGSNWTFTTSGGGIYSATFECTDECGAVCGGTIEIAVDVNEPPVLSCPADISIDCEASTDPSNTGMATAIDDNDPAPAVSYTDTETGGGCPQEKTIARRWKAIDECGDSAICIQIITVEDNDAPILTCPSDLTIDCSASTDPLNTGMATAIDNCNQNVDITYSDAVVDNTITRTWTATDDCGNSISCDQAITIVDTTAPTLACPSDVSVQCIADVPAVDIGAVTVSDDCDPNPVVTHVGDVSDGGSCPVIITRTYRATDASGNYAECTQTITIDDDIAPVIECPASLTIDCSDPTGPANTGYAIATDNCDADPDIAYSDNVNGDVITRTWTATDDCDNASSCVQTITIVDNTAPTLACPDDINVQCPADVLAADIGLVTVSDDCDPDPVVTHVGDASDGNTCPEIITRTYRATDASGNFADCTQTITINDDTAPIIECPANIEVDCSQSTEPDFTGFASATDNCDVDPEVTYADSENGDIITRTWTAADDCGNSIECIQTITILPNDPPVCNLPSDQEFFVCSDTIFNFAVSATDDQEVTCTKTSGAGDFDGTTWSFTTTGPGNYTAEFECTDICGALCSGAVTITVDYNSDPVCYVPNDTSIFQCEASEICLPVWADDPDDNLAECEVLSGPGSIVDGNWCYTPSGNETVNVTVMCADECGQTCEAEFQVEFMIHDRWAVITVDRSGSMALVDLAGKSRLARARTQAHDDIDKLLDPSDPDFPAEYEVAIMAFNETGGIVLLQDFTNNSTLLHDAVDAIQNPRHDTPLAAAMCQGHCMMPALDGCVRYLFTYTDGLENVSQNFDMCDLCEPCNQYMESGWLYDCDPGDPGSCTDWQLCLSDEFSTSGTNVVHYFGEPLNPYTKTNPPVDMYFLMAAAANSDGLFFYHSDLEMPPYTCGDANGDEGINVSDAVYVINYVFIGGEAPEPLRAADANCDGAVNVSDAVYIINYVFVGGATPCDLNGDGAPDC